MPSRRLPVRPDLDQLRHQAKDLLRAFRSGDPDAVEQFATHHPDAVLPATAKLADAQLVLARGYDAPSWARLVLAYRIVDAIWRNDLNTVREIVTESPALLHEHALIRTDSNWGPPLSYAANLGRDEIIRMLHSLGASDLQHAIGRATLQGRTETARMLYQMAGTPTLPDNALDGPAYTLSASGTALMLELGATVCDEHGNRVAPVNVVLFSDSRKPEEKHRILEMYVEHGIELPDTPTMALHRGRLDLLEAHLRRDPMLLERTFSHEEIYPPELGCDDYIGTQGTPLAGTTLLHLCVDYDEIGIATWLLDRGMDADVRAAIDDQGFGGHTPLFGAVVCYANFWGNYRGENVDSPFARLLLDRGANPNAHASLRKTHTNGEVQECRDVTPLAWGQQFKDKLLVSESAMSLLADRGGTT